MVLVNGSDESVGDVSQGVEQDRTEERLDAADSISDNPPQDTRPSLVHGRFRGPQLARSSTAHKGKGHKGKGPSFDCLLKDKSLKELQVFTMLSSWYNRRIMAKNSANTESANGLTQPKVEGLYVALELMELGIELVRQRFVRENPGASEEAIRQYVNAWLQSPRSGTANLKECNTGQVKS